MRPAPINAIPTQIRLNLWTGAFIITFFELFGNVQAIADFRQPKKGIKTEKTHVVETEQARCGLRIPKCKTPEDSKLQVISRSRIVLRQISQTFCHSD